MTYTLYQGIVLREDGASIPFDLRNADYLEYLMWLADGNTPSPPPQPTHAQLWERAIAEMRALRQPIIDVLDGLQISSWTLGLAERAQVIETAKQGLRDITKLDLNDCTTYEQMRMKVGLAYAVLVASLPSDIRAAFKEVTQ